MIDIDDGVGCQTGYATIDADGNSADGVRHGQ
jgi:hypothetical protein